MANRMFSSNRLALEKAVVDLFGVFTTAVDGAATLDTTKSKGIKSVAKAAGNGIYTVTLADSYQRLLDSNVKVVGSPAYVFDVTDSATSKTITLSVFDAVTGSAVEPLEEATVGLHFTLANSSAV